MRFAVSCNISTNDYTTNAAFIYELRIQAYHSCHAAAPEFIFCYTS
jgi:hypothetical protein